MKLEIPSALAAEHQQLHAELLALVDVAGPVGDAARAVAKLLHPHFVKEEAYALPPLGLLREVARGRVTAAMRPILALTDRLAAEYSRMLAEHKTVVAALERLAAAAARAGDRPDAARFADALERHAETEEQVLYPAALLVGTIVRERLGEGEKTARKRHRHAG
jgi:hypothetical protein